MTPTGISNISEIYIIPFRKAIRITNNKFDDEISDLIGAARTDLLLGGILLNKVCDEKDYLIKRAIMSYVKAEFGLDNSDAAKYRESYDMLKRHLMLSDEYTKG